MFPCRPVRRFLGINLWLVQVFSLASSRRSRTGRWVTHNSLKVLEALRVAPRGNGSRGCDLEPVRGGYGGGWAGSASSRRCTLSTPANRD